MDRRAKVELFELIRQEYEFGAGTIKGVAEKLGVHRRAVRQALYGADPPDRKRPVRVRAVLGPAVEFIDRILEDDRRAPRKQRHTAKRIWVRILEELPDCRPAASTVREYIRDRKREFAQSRRDVTIPQAYAPGEQAQVDWYEAEAEMSGVRRKVFIFSMRSMYSGAAFHRAYPSATQQAFLEAHEFGFIYHGGVFATLRYDNLTSAVRRVLRGSRREETTRFIAFRSHWQYDASFCTPGEGHEKGGVEGEVGYFRRNHLVPVPKVADFDELNALLLEGCVADRRRLIGDRTSSVGEMMAGEREWMRPLQSEDFAIGEDCYPRVDTKGCVRVRVNHYSTPLAPGTQPHVCVLPLTVEIRWQGQVVARHERSYDRHQYVLDLEHYLDVLARKPGALRGARALAQWRENGRWPPCYDQLWERLSERLGRSEGSRAMIDLLGHGRRLGYDRLTAAIEAAIEYGCADASAVTYLLEVASLERPKPPALDVGELERFTCPAPEMSAYDGLLERRAR